MFAVAPAVAASNDQGIDQRKVNQQNRINQGGQSGQLTPKEAGKLVAIVQRSETIVTTRLSLG